MRKEFRVSTKAVIFHPDHSKVLVIHMNNEDDYGLPGGHVEENETPDDAMRRELLEECGIICDSLERKDFFLHSNGKLILAYIGVVSKDDLSSLQNELEGIPKWLSREEFEKITIEPAYCQLVLSNW